MRREGIEAHCVSLDLLARGICSSELRAPGDQEPVLLDRSRRREGLLVESAGPSRALVQNLSAGD